jgi:tetratricopeptide (TPR) repeat protein
MSGKKAYIALIAALLAFGYLFVMNPQVLTFKLLPGHEVNTSFALLCFLFFLAGFTLAHFLSAFREVGSSLKFWLHKRGEDRLGEAGKLLNLGAGQNVRGNSRAARRLLKRARKMAPDHTRIAIELARAELMDGRHKDAKKRLDELLKLDSKNPEAIALEVELHKKLDDFEGQVAAYNRWLELDPNHIPSLTGLRDLYKRVGHNGEAARIQEKLLKGSAFKATRVREQAELVELRHAHALSLGHAEAITELNKLLKQSDYAPSYLALGELYSRADDSDSAEKTWLKGYSSTGQVGLLLRVETERVRDGRSEEMLTFYRKTARKRPVAGLLRARLMVSLGQNEEAIPVLEKLAPAIQHTHAAKALLGEAYIKRDQFEKAANALREEGASKLAFSCTSCTRHTAKWAATCPACGGEDTLEIDLAVPQSIVKQR